MADHPQAQTGREDPSDQSVRRPCRLSGERSCCGRGSHGSVVWGAGGIARSGAVSRENGAGAEVGLVLGGGGARGAYISGVLSVLLPELKDQVRVIVGTSAGALVASYLVANWHRPAQEAIDDESELLA